MKTDYPETVALQALTYLLSNDHLKERFQNITGADEDIIRDSLGEVSFLASILEFYIMHEPDLLDFAQDNDITPENIIHSWRQLGGGQGQEW